MSKQYSSASFLTKLEQAFADFVFLAIAALCVGGTIAMLLGSAPVVA